MRDPNLYLTGGKCKTCGKPIWPSLWGWCSLPCLMGQDYQKSIDSVILLK